jgi:hypothetical protein
MVYNIAASSPSGKADEWLNEMNKMPLAAKIKGTSHFYGGLCARSKIKTHCLLNKQINKKTRERDKRKSSVE